MKRLLAVAALLVCASVATAQPDPPRPFQVIGPASKVTCDNETMELAGDPRSVQTCLEALDTQSVPVLRATDCTAQTGIEKQFCQDSDDDTLYNCTTTTCSGAGWVLISGGGGSPGADQVQVDGVAASDPDFRSEGDIDVIRCTGVGTPDAACLAAEDVIFRDLIGPGEAGMFELCRRGGKGVAYNSTSDTYGATCGNYAWSAESGGISGGIATAATYLTATTSGGNAFTLTCSGVGVGTGSDSVTYDVTAELQPGNPTDATVSTGSTTTTLEDTGVGFTTNAYRDQIVTLMSGDCNGVSRLITGNDTDTLTIQGTWDGTGGDACTGAPTFPASTNTYVIRDPLGSICNVSGDFARVNAMADMMLAQDHTRPGGKVYLPVASGKSNTLYVHRGCGRKGHGPTGTSFNACPVLRYPNDHQFQRDIATVSGIEFVWEGTDPDGWSNGRTGAWYIDDNGSGKAETIWIGIDPSDGTANERWPLKAGADTLPKQCAPNAAGHCQPATVATLTRSMNRTGRHFDAFHSADVTTKSTWCANNQDSVSGTCEDDPRIVCTADANCDFSAGGAGNRGNLGPCQSMAELLDDLVANGDAYVGIGQLQQTYPETAISGTDEHVVARITAVSASTCGSGSNGRLFSFNGWPWPYAAFRNGSGTFDLYDWKEYNQEGGGHRGGTFSPNNWYGRDLNASGTSDQIGDCLAGGVPSGEVLDEPVCDTAHLVASYGGFRAHMADLVVTNAGSEGFGWDGSIASYLGRVRNVIYRDNKRKGWMDWSSMEIAEHVSWIDNRATGFTQPASMAFAGPHSILREFLWQGNRSENGFLFGFSGSARNVRMQNWTFLGNSGHYGGILFTGGVNVSFDNFTFLGNGDNFQALGVWVAAPVHNLRISNWRIGGRGNVGSSGFTGFAPISIDPSKNAGEAFPISGVLIDDVRMDTPETNPCLVYLHNDAGNGVAEQSYVQITIRNSGVSNTNSATGAKLLCIDDLSDGGTSATDDGIMNQRFMPTWTGLSVNDVNLPDQPNPQMPAASCGDCDDPALVGRVCHITDDTAANACTDAGVDGILDGGGTARSICTCGS